MATQTPILKLIKPAPSDLVNVSDYNINLDRVDKWAANSAVPPVDEFLATINAPWKYLTTTKVPPDPEALVFNVNPTFTQVVNFYYTIIGHTLYGHYTASWGNFPVNSTLAINTPVGLDVKPFPPGSTSAQPSIGTFMLSTPSLGISVGNVAYSNKLGVLMGYKTNNTFAALITNTTMFLQQYSGTSTYSSYFSLNAQMSNGYLSATLRYEIA